MEPVVNATQEVSKPTKLLLAIDDSRFSDAVAKCVTSHYSPKGTVVRVLNVANVALPTKRALTPARQLVDRGAQSLRKLGFTVETAVDVRKYFSVA